MQQDTVNVRFASAGKVLVAKRMEMRRSTILPNGLTVLFGAVGNSYLASHLKHKRLKVPEIDFLNAAECSTVRLSTQVSQAAPVKSVGLATRD